MSAAATAMDGLKKARPEWQPWLAVIDEALHSADADAWDAAVPDAARDGRMPLLAGVTIAADARVLRRFLDRLIRAAVSSGTEPMTTLRAVATPALDVGALFGASIRQDAGAISALAAAPGADAEALQAVVALLPVPFLQACNRRWAGTVPVSWTEGHCPVCGSWPALTEVRGIARSRYHRCGRCGGEWHARALHCVFCAMHDHHELVTLVPESGGSHAVIEACQRCRGYVKTFTRLQGGAPDAVMVEDLASIALDLSAIAAGYERPAGAAVSFEVAVTAPAAARGFFGWRA